MSRADDLMHEAHGLAETIRRRRTDDSGQQGREAGGVQAMEARLAGLWMDIRAARAAGPGVGVELPSNRRTRPKWE